MTQQPETRSPSLQATLDALASDAGADRRGAFAALDDGAWFELHCAVEADANPLPRLLPDVPRDAVRQIFSARAGRVDFEEAFAFYVHTRALWQRFGSGGPILDFGCGWGRILRFWLRDLPPEELWGADCFSYAVNWFRRTRNPARVLHVAAAPPLTDPLPAFSLIYAYSVFSHLCEDMARRWIAELAARLRPGGLLVVSTRGNFFLDVLDELRAAPSESAHIERTLEAISSPDAIRRRVAAGEFVFVQTHDGDGELRGEHYGEAWIPRRWAEDVAAALALRLVAFDEVVPGLDQPVIAYRKE